MHMAKEKGTYFELNDESALDIGALNEINTITYTYGLKEKKRIDTKRLAYLLSNENKFGLSFNVREYSLRSKRIGIEGVGKINFDLNNASNVNEWLRDRFIELFNTKEMELSL